MQEELLTCLPKMGHVMTVSESLMRVGRLQKEPIYRFCNREAQSGVGVLHELLATMELGSPPNLTALEGKRPVWLTIRTRIDLFCVANVPNAEDPDGAPRVLQGKPALAHVFATMQAKFAAKEELPFGSLEPLHIFSYLLQDAQKEEVATWTSEALKKAAGETQPSKKRAAPTKGNGQGASSSGSRAKSAKVKSEPSDVLVLFQ